MDSEQCIVRELASAFSRYAERLEITLPLETSDVLKYLNSCRQKLDQLLKDRLKSMKGLKFWLCATATYHRSEDITEETEKFFPNITQIVLNDLDISEGLDASFVQIIKEVENYEENGSDWVIKTIDSLDLFTVGYTPLRASSYAKLPRTISLKHAIVNVKNNDNRCFIWAILSALYPVARNPQRVSNYRQHEDVLDVTGLQFPVKLRDISKFETRNEISVNVFTCTSESDARVFPLYRTKEKKLIHVNLFFFDDHYSAIASFDRLLGDQTRHNGTGFYCEMCLYPMFSAERLEEHARICRNDSMAALDMPSDDDKELKFTNIHRMLRKPTVVYADFESILKPLAGCTPNPKRSHTVKYQHHTPCSYGMVVAKSCCGDPTFENLIIETTENSAAKFLTNLIDIANARCSQPPCLPLQMCQDDEDRFRNAEKCFVCEERLGDDRVRDHCHVCGQFRGALHNHCNQMLRLDRDLVVVMHNLRRYDSHIIMQALGPACQQHGLKISCVARGMEDYVTFSIGQGHRGWKIRFIDSVQFMQGSLEQLVDQLNPDQFKAMDAFFSNEHANLLRRKGVFCYDFLDSWDKMQTLHPILKSDFYNKLNKTNISDIDYQHYLDVCRVTGVKDLKEYMEMYLKTDVLLLADVFEEFRKFSIENFGLDPCHFVTLPGLAWDACLKMTKVKLELITDPEIYSFIEQGIRGGISIICQRFAKANNKYMKKWERDKLTSFILYLDMNNLYGWALREMLPLDRFRMLTQEEIAQLILADLDPEGELGYILEVDLEYPEVLHDRHNCYPVAPEHLEIAPDMLSPYCREVAEKHGLKLKPVTKLLPNLKNKTQYIVHFRTLLYYKSLGLNVGKIHRVLEFRQSAWMAKYVDFNTEMRRLATTDFGKNLHKFFVNAVFGKTMENVRNYSTVELVTDERRLIKITKKPQFKQAVIFNEHLVGCSIGRSVIKLNKPIYAGFSVLDLSKLLMYKFHYEYIRPLYEDQAKLLMSDTDSLMYIIETQRDVYLDMLEHQDQFDTPGYPEGHFLKSDVNKKVVGVMKDELDGEPAEEFLGMRAKMYSLKTETGEKKRAKGVKRKVVRDEITHEDYCVVIKEREIAHHSMNAIRNFKHQLFSISMNKKTLSCYDDKRYILPDGITTLAYGHRDIP